MKRPRPLNRSRFAEVLAQSNAQMNPTVWQSRLLVPLRPQTLTRMENIVRDCMRPSPISAEVRRFVSGVGGVQSPELWDLYFSAYDQVVGFTPDYVRLIEAAAVALPRRGAIVDLGSGTGNFSLGLRLSGQQRALYAVDMSLSGLRLTQKKLNMADASPERAMGIYHSPLKNLPRLRLPRCTGAVMNNVLYSLSPSDRHAVMKSVADLIQPGGIFVLNDPTPSVQNAAADFENFIGRVCAGAYSNDSRATEFDYALITYMNHASLVSKSPPFLSRFELRRLAQHWGFELLHERSAYYGHSTLLVLKKAA